MYQAIKRAIARLDSGIQLAYLQVLPPNGQQAKRTVLIAHATGFNKEVYLPFIEDIQANDDDATEFISYDARNHGDSYLLNRTLLSDEPINWINFGQDASDFAKLLKTQRHHPIYAIGHSGGGAAVIWAEALSPGIFAGIVGVEPIIISRQHYSNAPHRGPSMSAAALKRRAFFESRQQILENFQSKQFFSKWDPRALKHYAFDGARDRVASELESDQANANLKVALKCPPKQEWATFEGSQTVSALFEGGLQHVQCPVLLIKGKQSFFPTAEVIEDAAKRMPRAETLIISDMDHLMLMEKPHEMAVQYFLPWLRRVDRLQSSKL